MCWIAKPNAGSSNACLGGDASIFAASSYVENPADACHGHWEWQGRPPVGEASRGREAGGYASRKDDLQPGCEVAENMAGTWWDSLGLFEADGKSRTAQRSVASTAAHTVAKLPNGQRPCRHPRWHPQGGRSGSVPQHARSRLRCGLKRGAAAPEASLEGQRKRNVPRPAAVSMLEPSKLLLANQRRANRAAAIATLSAGERVTLLRRIA